MRTVAAQAVIAATVVLVAATGCGSKNVHSNGPADGSGNAIRRVVLVSGRDDHGLVASPNIVLRSAAEGGDVVGRVPDGTLARVREVRGTKVQVSASGITGWVDDFALRGELRLAGPPPNCRVRLAGRDLPAGTRVEVLSLDGPSAMVRLLDAPHTVGTVPASEIGELAPTRGQRCPSAGTGRMDGH